MAALCYEDVSGQRSDGLTLCSKDDLRASFALAMSAMYQQEVPLYGKLIDVTRRVNRAVAESKEFIMAERLDMERHGAIRLGTPFELRLPMHATAFRPVESKALSKTPFRVFTTLLRPELLEDEARELALSPLGRRKIFSAELMHSVEAGERQGGFTEEQVLTSNHLTPRVLDIVEAEKQMKGEGLNVKSKIEGPPPRNQPILLRQTSFLALQEEISFPTYDSDTLVDGSHKARFGKIEQRGTAVTAKGRALYDTLLQKALEGCQSESHSKAVLADTFEACPDNLEDLLRKGLIFCTFHCTEKESKSLERTSSGFQKLSALTAAGLVKAHPIVYEDFLPFSAAGIFRSNLQGSASSDGGLSFEVSADRAGFEDALGCSLSDSERLYAEEQARSLAVCASRLGLEGIIVDADARD